MANFSEEKMDDENLIKMAALGRDFQLGTLYDYRSDVIVQGNCLHLFLCIVS